MTRWFLRVAVAAAGWGWVGPAPAQTLPPAALANTGTVPPRPAADQSADWPAVRAAAPEVASSEAAVLLMRTTGQPDRRLKVLKRSTYSDGESLVDVRDLTTGQTFTLPGKLADRLPRESAGMPQPADHAAFPPPPVAAQVPPPPRFIPTEPVAPAAPKAVALPPPAPQPVPQAMPVPGGHAETVWRPANLTQPVPPTPAPATVPPQAQQPTLVPIGSAALPAPGALPRATPTPATPAPSGDRWKPIPAPVPTPSPYPNPPRPLSSNAADDGIVARGQMFPQYPAQPVTITLPRVLDRTPAKSPPAIPQPVLATSFTIPAGRPPARTTPGFQAPEVKPPEPRFLPRTVEPPPTVRPPEPKPIAPAFAPAMEPKIPLARPPEPKPASPAPKPKPAPVPAPVPEPKPVQQAGVVRLTVPDAPEPAPAPPVAQQVQYQQRATGERRWAEADDAWLVEIVRREMQPMADQLANALRPSVRINAAFGLADMRYAARPEVKAVLAKAAMTDPAALVRTVCVRELARLGYKELGYVDYLRETAHGDGGAPEQLRLAALDALRVVTPRD